MRTETILIVAMRIVLDASARLLRLLPLPQTRLYWSGRELARLLGVISRSVRRDITGREVSTGR